MINITKQNDEPAKISVKFDGKTWEITEIDIDSLPAEIREQLKSSAQELKLLHQRLKAFRRRMGADDPFKDL